MSGYNVLIMGATYGSLLAIKLALAGHHCKLVCQPHEAALINTEGIHVRIPVKGYSSVELESRNAPGTVAASRPADVNPGEYDLVVLAMHEPQFSSPDVRELTLSIAGARVPCMSVMNMPPLPYLARIPGLDLQSLRHAYTEPEVWDAFDPALMTLCSADPQAAHPPEEAVNVLQVFLATNFRAARFESDSDTAILRDLGHDIDGVRYETSSGKVELPVRLKVHDSVFVPLSNWNMLIAGNYRCVRPGEIVSIYEAVNADLEHTRRVYEWVGELVRTLGAAPEDQVSFDKYIEASKDLVKPAVAARALFDGISHIERVDRLVQAIGEQQDMHLAELDEIVRVIDRHLEMNRAAA